MSILKRVPNNIRQLRDFLTHEAAPKNKYYYFANDFDNDPDNYYNKNDPSLFRDETTGMLMSSDFDPPEEASVGYLIPLGHFNTYTKNPKYGNMINFYDPEKLGYDPAGTTKHTIKGKLLNIGRFIFEEELKNFASINHLVYTDYPPAAGSVPLTYDDYIESIRVNDLDGGRKKTRNRKNIKFKKTRKYKGRRRNQ